jgi:hypothetical protein
MSRLDLLRMKRDCASYGPPLTPYEQVELHRLEDELDDLRYGRLANPGAPARESAPSRFDDDR